MMGVRRGKALDERPHEASKIMKLINMHESVVDWSETAAIRVPGAAGYSSTRTQHAEDFQLRVVEYAPGYLADHWCSKGPVMYVIVGALAIEHRDDRPACALSAGMSWHVADQEGSPHRVRSDNGATVFIVD
jgi:hypothetical protein